MNQKAEKAKQILEETGIKTTEDIGKILIIHDATIETKFLKKAKNNNIYVWDKDRIELYKIIRRHIPSQTSFALLPLTKNKDFIVLLQFPEYQHPTLKYKVKAYFDNTTDRLDLTTITNSLKEVKEIIQRITTPYSETFGETLKTEINPAYFCPKDCEPIDKVQLKNEIQEISTNKLLITTPKITAYATLSLSQIIRESTQEYISQA